MKKIIVAAVAAFVSTSAFAQMPPYVDLDANADGFVSPEEAKAKMPSMTDADWKKMDADGDNKVTLAEYNMVGK